MFDIANYFEESNFDYDVNEAPFFSFKNEEVELETVKDFAYFYATHLLKKEA